MSLDDVAFTAPVLGEVQAALARPFVATYDARGQLRQVHLAEGNAQASQLLRLLMASTQFTYPDQDGAEWTAVEENMAGRYRAKYKKERDAEYLRQRVAYLGDGAPSETSVQKIEVSEARFEFGSDGRFRKLSLLDTESTQVGSGEGMRARTRLSATLEWTGHAAPLSSEQAKLGLVARAVAGSTKLSPEQRAELDRKAVAGASFADLSRELGRLPKGDGQARANFFGRTSALFRMSETAVADAERSIRAGSSEAGYLMSSLAHAGTPAAQRAITRIAADPGQPANTRTTALMQLTTVEHPSLETATQLEALLDDSGPGVQEHGAYALGAVGSRLEEADPAARAWVTEVLVDRLETAGTEAESIRWLEALGNAGDIAALPSVAAALASSTEAVRSAAVRALRFMPGEEVDSLIGLRLTADISAEVRLAAAFAVSFRTAASMHRFLKQALEQDREAEVRRAVIDALGRELAGHGTSQALLAWAREHDPDRSNQQLAAGYVAQQGQRG